MKQNRLQFIFFLILFCLGIYSQKFFPKQEKIGKTVSREFYAMGTRLWVEVTATDEATALLATENAYKAIHQTELRLSTWQDSELNRLNQLPAGELVVVSSELAHDLEQVLHCTKLSEGYFDPTIGPLIDIWDLRGHGRIPSQDEINSALAVSGLAVWEFNLDSNLPTAMRLKPGARIEEGGFAKGLALDYATQKLTDLDLIAWQLNFGGQMAVHFTKAHTIPIADPVNRQYKKGEVVLQKGHLSTTGNSEHNYTINGKSFGHILNPKTGQPIQRTGSITIVAQSGLMADCLSTAVFAMDSKERQLFKDKLQNQAQIVELN